MRRNGRREAIRRARAREILSKRNMPKPAATQHAGTVGAARRFVGMNCHLQPLAKPAPPPPGPTPRAFDRWLQDELARRYDSALAEPVPEELLRLLRETH